MTLNEKIAEKMGWGYLENDPRPGAYVIADCLEYPVGDLGTDTPAGHWLMSLMIKQLNKGPGGSVDLGVMIPKLIDAPVTRCVLGFDIFLSRRVR